MEFSQNRRWQASVDVANNQHYSRACWPSTTWAFASITLVALISGCVPRQENEVVVYCSTDREFANPILNAFHRTENAAEVVSQFDVESSKTLGLATRIIQEKSQPRCDVFWSGEVLHTIRLQKAGLLKRRNWKLPSGWPAGFAASDGSWAGLGARGRVLFVNRDKLRDETAWPKKVHELSDQRWKGRCGMAKPLYGTTATHMTVLASNASKDPTSPKAFEDWIGQVQQNAVILSGNKQVAMAVASGELDWGLTDTDDAEIEIANGHPVSLIYPDQGSDDAGVLLIPGTVAVLAKSPHPMAADALANYLVSEKTEARLTLGNAAQFALWPSSKKFIGDTASEMKIMKVDFEEAAANWEQVFATLQSIFQ
jgi:iron(III) transport system substrate-binding protein